MTSEGSLPIEFGGLPSFKLPSLINGKWSRKPPNVEIGGLLSWIFIIFFWFLVSVAWKCLPLKHLPSIKASTCNIQRFLQRLLRLLKCKPSTLTINETLPEKIS